MIGLGVVTVAAVGGAAVYVIVARDDRPDRTAEPVEEPIEPVAPLDADEAPVATTAAAITTTGPISTTGPTSTTLPPERLVEVDEVWLLDRGEGEYDWGLTLSVPTGAPTRSDVQVSVRLVDDDAEVIETVERSIDGVNERPTAVAGRLTETDGVPDRLEFDVTIGRESDDGLPDDVLWATTD